MKKFISTTLLFLSAKVIGTLPAGRYHLSRKDFNGNKLPIAKWSYISKADEKNKEGNFPLHVVNSSGIWDATKSSYVTHAGKVITFS